MDMVLLPQNGWNDTWLSIWALESVSDERGQRSKCRLTQCNDRRRSVERRGFQPSEKNTRPKESSGLLWLSLCKWRFVVKSLGSSWDAEPTNTGVGPKRSNITKAQPGASNQFCATVWLEIEKRAEWYRRSKRIWLKAMPVNRRRVKGRVPFNGGTLAEMEVRSLRRRQSQSGVGQTKSLSERLRNANSG
jgi:hypothetical protein